MLLMPELFFQHSKLFDHGEPQLSQRDLDEDSYNKHHFAISFIIRKSKTKQKN